MAEMSALRAHRRGGPDVLIVEQAPVPVPGEGEVLVAVHAAAITFDELTWDETWSRLDRAPAIPSHEFSGVVAGVGSGVSDVAVGDEVYGLIGFDRDGAAAEYLTVPAADLAARPSSVSHTVAAALPLAGLTALQALADHADVRPGERVLVHGGAGGVGMLAVQLARLLGATVSATVRSDAGLLLAQLGAERTIDTRTERFDESATRYDVVIDTVGGETLARSFAVLRPAGRLVTLSAPPPAGLADEYGVQATFFVVRPDRGQLRQLAELVDAGRLSVQIADTYPLQQGRAAFESGRNDRRRSGKTVIVVRG